MPNLPITQLPSASALQLTDVFPVVQGGITKQTPFSSIVYAQGNSYGLFAQTANSTIITGTTTESTLINGGVGTLVAVAPAIVARTSQITGQLLKIKTELQLMKN